MGLGMWLQEYKAAGIEGWECRNMRLWGWTCRQRGSRGMRGCRTGDMGSRDVGQWDTEVQC